MNFNRHTYKQTREHIRSIISAQKKALTEEQIRSCALDFIKQNGLSTGIDIDDLAGACLHWQKNYLRTLEIKVAQLSTERRAGVMERADELITAYGYNLVAKHVKQNIIDNNQPLDYAQIRQCVDDFLHEMFDKNGVPPPTLNKGDLVDMLMIWQQEYLTPSGDYF